MSFKVSIIIPIFNAEESLEKSIESIINQTIGFESLELILVDDHSTDDSRRIIENYAKKYSNVIPLFLENNSGGASIPRNKGLKYATSEYIMFMDSDDEYEQDICEKFYNAITSEKSDLVSCNFNIIDSIHTSQINFDLGSLDKIETDDRIIMANEELISFDNVYVWNKIFKKSIIVENNITFKESISEDFIFCMEYLIKTEKRIYLKDYYGYNKNLQEESLSIKGISLNTVYNHINVDYMISKLIKQYVKDKTKLKRINNLVFKDPIKWIVEELVTVPSKDVKEGLYKLNEFEKDIEFEESLDNPLLNTINNMILSEKWNRALMMLKTGNVFLNSTKIRKVYRILSESKR